MSLRISALSTPICTTTIPESMLQVIPSLSSGLYRLKAVAGIRLEQNSLDGINDKLVPVLRAGLNWQAADFTF